MENDGLILLLQFLSSEELASHASVLIPSGTETMAAVLTGVVYYTTIHLKSLEMLVSEVRCSFEREDEINIVSVQKLSYMLAVLDEVMRLRPGAPSGQARVIAEGGDIILGKFVPAGVSTRQNHHLSLISRYLPRNNTC